MSIFRLTNLGPGHATDVVGTVYISQPNSANPIIAIKGERIWMYPRESPVEDIKALLGKELLRRKTESLPFNDITIVAEEREFGLNGLKKDFIVQVFSDDGSINFKAMKGADPKEYDGMEGFGVF